LLANLALSEAKLALLRGEPFGKFKARDLSGVCAASPPERRAF
jgi:hypothetical protein